MSNPSIAPYFPFARMKVTGQDVHLELDHPGTLIRLEPDQRFRPVCHACGTHGRVHARGLRRFIRDLDIGPAQTLLDVTYRRVFCSSCRGAKVEKLSFAEPSKRITERLARYVYELCKILTVEDVSRHLALDPKTVKEVDKRFLQEEFGETNYEGLEVLAIDEVALKKGPYGYMTVVMDYLTGRIVWMGEGRDKDTLDRFFGGMTEEQKRGIQAVAMDLWDPFINRVEHHCPQAKIVFDLFHLVKLYGDVIDEVRREEVRKAESREDRRFIKGSRYLLLRNAENLRFHERARLRELLAVNERISSVYMLKDQLKMIYRYRRRGWARRALNQWREMAAQVDHPLMRRFIGCLYRHEEGILNHCDYPIGTSPLEGANNKIKVLKRKAYGFHDTEYFILKVKQALPGHKTTTETG